MNGNCTLGALLTPRTKQYFLYVSAGKQHKRFSISEEKFASLLQKNHYTIRSNDEVLYPCQYGEITVQFIPHFEFLVE